MTLTEKHMRREMCKMEKTFLKVVCEAVDVLHGKQILVDENCKDLDEALSIMEKYPDLLKHDKVWMIYPMSVTI